MATTITPPAASTPPAGASAYEKISAATSGIVARFANDTDTGDTSNSIPDSSPPPVESTPVPDQATPPAVETTPAPAEGVTPPEQAEPPNFYETEPLGSDIPQATLDTFLQTQQGKDIVQGYRTLTELAKPVDQGGIKHIPTTEQIRNYFLAYRDRVMMDSDLNSGDPKQLGRFFNHVFNPNRGEQGNVAIAGQLPGFLASNPALYTAVMEPFLKHYQDTLMERFKETKGFREGTDDPVADALWFAASILNKDLNGEYLTPLPGAGGENGTVVNTVDPKLAADRAKFERERAEFDRQKQESTKAHNDAWANAYHSKVGELLTSELDQALAPAKALFSGAPAIYKAFCRQCHDEVVAALNSNTVGMELHNTNLNDAFRAGTLQSAHAIAEAYRDMARDIIRANRKKFLEGAGVSVMATNQQRHNEAAAINGNNGPRGGGAGVPSTAQTPPLQKEKDESQPDYILRMVKAATANKARAMVRQ